MCDAARGWCPPNSHTRTTTTKPQGETRTELGEYTKAVDAYRAALKAKGSDFELLQGLTAAQIQAGNPQSAVGEVQALLSQGESSGYGQVELQLLLGRVYSLWKGHGGDALVIYDQLIKVCWCGRRYVVGVHVVVRRTTRETIVAFWPRECCSRRSSGRGMRSACFCRLAFWRPPKHECLLTGFPLNREYVEHTRPWICKTF